MESCEILNLFLNNCRSGRKLNPLLSRCSPMLPMLPSISRDFANDHNGRTKRYILRTEGSNLFALEKGRGIAYYAVMMDEKLSRPCVRTCP